MLRRREVLLALLLFSLPSASFTLTNVLGGIGADFGASEREVSLLAGVGSVAAGVCGSLLLPLLARRFPPRPLYLGIGVAGALFTLVLLLPRTPAAFAVAITGENAFQALAFAAAFAISFAVIGPGNPLTVPIFSLLVAATNLPIVYMGFMDGRGYTLGGVRGALCTDAGVSLAVYLLPAGLLRARAVRSGLLGLKVNSRRARQAMPLPRYPGCPRCRAKAFPAGRPGSQTRSAPRRPRSTGRSLQQPGRFCRSCRCATEPARAG